MMGTPVRRMVRLGAAGVVVLAPAASTVALALGQGYGAAMALAGVQAVALGVALWGRRRWAGSVVAVALLAALALGGRHSAAAGLLAMAGLFHAMVYAGLLGLFAASLRPGREAVVTRFARALNPGFHDGMVGYTRGVTRAWCAFFAAQLAGSLLLLTVAPAAWAMLVTGLHAPLVAGMAAAEFLVRRRRFRHGPVTGLAATISGVRAMMAKDGA